MATPYTETVHEEKCLRTTDMYWRPEIKLFRQSDERLRFAVQNLLPLPDNIIDSEYKNTQESIMQSIGLLGNNQCKWLPCGSYEEWLSLPYNWGEDQYVVTPEKMAYLPDIDILQVNNHVLAITDREKHTDLLESSSYTCICLMRHFLGTHQGYVLLELISCSAKEGEPCKACSRLECSKKLAQKSTLYPLKLKTGEIIYCIPSFVREEQEARVEGPALKRLTSVGHGIIAETDHVNAIFCPDWPPMASEWLTRCRPAYWPTSEMLNGFRENGCYLVPVGYKKSPLFRCEWRVSFSRTEIQLARSLTNNQRQSFLILKSLVKCSLSEPQVLTTYHLKTALFWRCENISRDNWTLTNMADHVMCLLDFIIECLSKKNLPHYFIPSHNLFDHLQPEEIEEIQVKAQAMKTNIKHHIIECFVTFMPCCVKGYNLICGKELYKTVLFPSRETCRLETETKKYFLHQLALYYLLLKCYDIFHAKMLHSLRYGNEEADKPALLILLETVLKTAPDSYIVNNYILWSKKKCNYDPETLEIVYQETIKSHFSLLPKVAQTDESYQMIHDHVYGDFIKRLFEQEARLGAVKQAQTYAYKAYILYQMDFIELSLENVGLGLQLLNCKNRQNFLQLSVRPMNKDPNVADDFNPSFKNKDAKHTNERLKSELGNENQDLLKDNFVGDFDSGAQSINEKLDGEISNKNQDLCKVIFVDEFDSGAQSINEKLDGEFENKNQDLCNNNLVDNHNADRIKSEKLVDELCYEKHDEMGQDKVVGDFDTEAKNGDEKLVSDYNSLECGDNIKSNSGSTSSTKERLQITKDIKPLIVKQTGNVTQKKLSQEGNELLDKTDYDIEGDDCCGKSQNTDPISYSLGKVTTENSKRLDGETVPEVHVLYDVKQAEDKVEQTFDKNDGKYNDMFAILENRIVFYESQRTSLDEELKLILADYFIKEQAVTLPTIVLLLYTKLRCLTQQEKYSEVQELTSSIVSLKEIKNIQRQDLKIILAILESCASKSLID